MRRRMFESKAPDSPSTKHNTSALESLEDEVRSLHGIEVKGESAATPFIAISGLWVFLALVFAIMLGCALTAYYVA